MSIREYSADVQSDWHDSNKSFITDRDKLKDSDAVFVYFYLFFRF